MADRQLYEVERILDKKVVPGRRLLYLVRWRGFSSEHDSWEPVKNLSACRKLIEIFKKNDDSPTSPSDSTRESPSGKSTGKNDGDKSEGASKNVKKPLETPKRLDGKTKLKPSRKSVNENEKLPLRNSTPIKNQIKKATESNAQTEDSGKKASLKKRNNESVDLDNHAKKKNLKRKHEDAETSKEQTGASKAKKSKMVASGSSPDENTKPKDSDSVIVVEDASDDDVQEIDDGEDDDDDDILYSLNDDCDNVVNNDKESKEKGDGLNLPKEKVETSPKSSVISDSTVEKLSSGKKKGGKGKKSMLLIDSQKKHKSHAGKADLLRSVSPPPMFTAVKDPVVESTSSDPSKPSGNSLPDPVSPEASETYLADVPSSYPVPAEEPLSDEQPLSPGSISYKSFLANLPAQFHPKGGKKAKSSTTQFSATSNQSGGDLNSSVGREPVERRTSVRSTECAFRYKQIVVKKCIRYTQIWLNTQTVMQNALNPQVIQEVVSALNSAKYDDSHLVLFSSLGSVFCSGTDLHFLVSGDRRMAARQMADSIRDLTKTFITFPKPIIAAVSGAAVGLAVSLLALCDIVYASDKASFHLPYSQLSQTPEGCSSFTLPLTLGLPSANELLFGGRKITAMEAYQLGLVSQVFWPTLMMQEVIPRAQNMATCSAKALEATKLLVRSHHRTKMELTNETECNLLLERWSSVDCQRAIELYLSNEKNLTF